MNDNSPSTFHKPLKPFMEKTFRVEASRFSWKDTLKKWNVEGVCLIATQVRTSAICTPAF